MPVIGLPELLSRQRVGWRPPPKKRILSEFVGIVKKLS